MNIVGVIHRTMERDKQNVDDAAYQKGVTWSTPSAFPAKARRCLQKPGGGSPV